MDYNGEIPGSSTGIPTVIPGDHTIDGNLTITGRIILPEGSTSEPSLTFEDNLDTGLSLGAGDYGKSMDFTVAGTLNTQLTYFDGIRAKQGMLNWKPAMMRADILSVPLSEDGQGFLDNFTNYHNLNPSIMTFNATTGTMTFSRTGTYKVSVTTIAGCDNKIEDGDCVCHVILMLNSETGIDEHPVNTVPASGLTATPMVTTSWFQVFDGITENDTAQFFAYYENYSLLNWSWFTFIVELIAPA
jgi:hypothetical protein